MNLDPQWVSVGVAVVYAVFTLLIVLESRKSRKDLQEREEKRIEQKKEDLRNLIGAELERNMEYINEIQEEVKKMESVPDHVLTKYMSCEDRVYSSIIGELGILTKIEIMAISKIYLLLNDLRKSYDSLPKDKPLSKFVEKEKIKNYIDEVKNRTNLTINLWNILGNFFRDKDYEKLEERYNDLKKYL
ncbi:MAG: hypothetical protein KAT49_02600 [Methanomicrobia archaeon]|nr:hypothetical protein [Methanomicrobia archaeon]